MKKPKMIFQMQKPGQSQEDFVREMKEKMGEGNEPQVLDASAMDPAQLQEMLAGLGISKEKFAEMTGEGGKKKKPGLFQRIQDAMLG